MMQRIRKLMAHEGGFTLIELLIVIIILGILAAIVVFSVLGVTSRGAQAACKADLKSVQVASEAYYAQNGSYAGSIAALVPSFLQAAPSATQYTVTWSGGGGQTPPTIATSPVCSSLT